MSDSHLDEAERLFSAALERATQDRADFIERECAGNPALLAELRLLLEADLAASTVVFPSPAVWLPPDTLAAGQIVAGRYRLLKPIGEGGLGTVWSAEQIAPVQRRVAMKFIRHDLNSRRVVARFAAERAALALMDHPGIARIFDAGVWDAGAWGAGVRDAGVPAAHGDVAEPPRPYVVMELVDGPPITVHCDRVMLPIRERVRLVAEVCRAVHHAHQKGILHRDLKPSNILTTLVNGIAVPKVIDFGIAKALGGDVLPDRTITRVGQFVGTPAYMAPEQLRGDAAHTDVRADIFAIGVVLHELLAGCLPHDRSSSGALSPPSRAHESATTETRAPSRSVRRLGADEATRIAHARGETPRSLRRRLKGELDWIVGRATASEPQRRYDSANELAADLSRWLVGEPIVAGPPTIRYRARKFVQRNTAAVVIAAILVIALVAGLVGTSAGLIRANAAEATARQAGDDAERSALAEAAQRDAAVVAQRRAELNAYRAEIAAASAAIVADDVAAAQSALAATDPTLRNWEWQRLAFVTDQSDMVIRPGPGRIFGLTLTSDDAQVILVGDDGSVRSHDARTGVPIARVDASLGNALRVAISPSGDRVIVAGYSDAAWTIEGYALLEWPSGVVIARGSGRAVIDDGALSDGKFIVSDADGGVEHRVVDLVTGAEHFSVNTRTAGVFGLARFAAGSEHLLVSDAASGDVAIVDYDGRATRRWRIPSLNEGWPRRAEYLVGTDPLAGHAVFLRFDDPQWRRTVAIGQGRRATGIEVSPDGRLAAVSNDRSGTVHLHDLEADQAIGSLRGHRRTVANPVFTSDGRCLFTASEDGTVRRWRLDSVNTDFRIDPVPGTGGFSAAFSSDATLLASGGWGSLELWDTSTGALRWSYHLTNRFVESIAFSPDNRRIVVAERNGRVVLLAAEDGALLREMPSLDGQQTVLAWDPLDRFVAIADARGSVHLIDLTGVDPVGTASTGAASTVRYELADGPISTLALSPDGTLFAAGIGVARRGTERGWTLVPDPEREPALVIGRIDGTEPPRRYRLPSGIGAIAFDSRGDSDIAHLYIGSVAGWLIAIEVKPDLTAGELPGHRWSVDGDTTLPTFGTLLDAADADPTSGDAMSDGSSRVVAILPAAIRDRVVVAHQSGTTSLLVAGVDAPVLRIATGRPRAVAVDRATETLMVSGSVPLQSFGLAHADPALVAARDRVIAVRAIVDPLVSRHRMTDAVMKALDADATIADELRADAASYARARGEHLAWVVSDAIVLAREREIDGDRADRLRETLARLDLVADRWQTAPGRFDFTRATLLLRLGEFTAASAEMDHYEKTRTRTSAPDLGVLAVRAILERRLGDEASARSIWSSIRARLDAGEPLSGETARYVLEAELEFERSSR